MKTAPRATFIEQVFDYEADTLRSRTLMVLPSTFTEILPSADSESPWRTIAIATFAEARFFSKALPFLEIFTFVITCKLRLFILLQRSGQIKGNIL